MSLDSLLRVQLGFVIRGSLLNRTLINFFVQSIRLGLFFLLHEFFPLCTGRLFQMKLHKLEYLSIGIHGQSN